MNYKTKSMMAVLIASAAFSQILTIYPEENATVKPEELSAVFTVDRGLIEQAHKDSLQLWFNGKNVSRYIRKEENVVLFSPDSIFLNNPDMSGASTLKLVIVSPKTSGVASPIFVRDSAEVSFFVVGNEIGNASDPRPIETMPFVNTGTAYTSQSYDNTTNIGRYIGEFGASGNGYKDKFFYNYNLYLNTDEESHLQTMQRFRATAGYGHVVKLSLGDVTPVMNEYIANADRIRGFELNLRTPSRRSNFDAVYGYSKRAISPYIMDDSALTASANALKSLYPDSVLTHSDSSSYYASGVFARRVIGSRIHFGEEGKSKYGFTLMQVRDDMESIKQKTDINIALTDTLVTMSGNPPKDNLMIGQDFAFSFWKKRITLSSNAALSILVEDIQHGPATTAEIEDKADLDPGTIPFDVEKLEPLLIVNTSILPLPSAKGVMNSSAIDAGIALNTPIKSAREKFEIKFIQIGSNYKSLLNESIAGNKRGFYVREELRLLNNKIISSVKYDFYRDNLNELKPKATETKKLTGMVNLTLKETIPQFYLSVSTMSDVNESPAISKLDKDNKSLLFNFGSSYTKKIGEVGNTFSAWFANTQSTARSFAAGESKSLTNGFGVNTVSSYPVIPLKSRLGYTHTISESDLKTSVVNPNIGLTYSLIPGKLELNGDGRFYRVINEYVIPKNETQTNRIEGSFSTNYTINEKHILSFNCAGLRSTNSATINPAYDYQFRMYYEFRY